MFSLHKKWLLQLNNDIGQGMNAYGKTIPSLSPYSYLGYISLSTFPYYYLILLLLSFILLILQLVRLTSLTIIKELQLIFTINYIFLCSQHKIFLHLKILWVRLDNKTNIT